MLFFFKQKTAYEMRISDWSSDVCSSDLELDVRLATGDTQAGTAVADLYPGLAAGYPDLIFTSFDADACAGLDLVFLGLPHGASQAVVPQLVGKVGDRTTVALGTRVSVR